MKKDMAIVRFVQGLGKIVSMITKTLKIWIMTSSDTEYLHITSSNRVDHDVFVNSPSYFEYLDYELINGKCCQLEVFSYARDLFAVFSAVLVRMYLNYSIEYFFRANIAG